MFPEELKYTAQHEWVKIPDGGGPVRIGITSHAQDALGDIVYVSLPATGTEVTAGEPFGEVESTKSVNDIYAPVSGRVVARNDVLETTPDVINNDPYGDGWMVEIDPTDGANLGDLLDAAAYRKLVDNS